MNNLSWLLYAADVIPGIGNLFFFLAFTTFTVGCILYLVGLICIHETNDQMRRDSLRSETWYPEAENQNKMWRYVLARLTFIGVPLILLFSVVSVGVPSSKTIYLIAGSEAGETVVTSEQGQAVLSDVQEIIKLQLEGMKQ